MADLTLRWRAAGVGRECLVSEAAYIPDVHNERSADALQHVHAHSFTLQQFSISALAYSGQANDVRPGIAAPFKESPQTRIIDHCSASSRMVKTIIP